MRRSEGPAPTEPDDLIQIPATTLGALESGYSDACASTRVIIAPLPPKDQQVRSVHDVRPTEGRLAATASSSFVERVRDGATVGIQNTNPSRLGAASGTLKKMPLVGLRAPHHTAARRARNQSAQSGGVSVR